MTAKEYLQQAYRIDSRVRLEAEKLAAMRSALYGRGVTYTSDGTQNNRSENGIERAIHRVMEYEERLDGEIGRLVDIRLKIEKTINAVPDSVLREVLTRRYLFYQKWDKISVEMGGTSYENFPIRKDKAVNEIIDGYDSTVVPDNLVADRLDSAGYALATQMDNDGATVLLAGATVRGITALTTESIYAQIVDIRTAMSKANIPDDGKRYLLVTPESFALILKSPEFVKASSLGDAVVQSGIIGKIAGFNVIEWNDSTANLAMIAGHPRFATRATEFSVPVKLQNLDGSGKYIGASAVQGRLVYDHKVLRSQAIIAAFTPGYVAITATAGTTKGDTKITVTAEGSNTLAYKRNPAARIAYGTSSTDYAGTAVTSGTALAVSGCTVGDIIEVAEFGADGKCIKVGYITLTANQIKA